MTEITIKKEEIDCLADILWWIKGFRAGADAANMLCPFNEEHEEALRKFRLYFLEKKEKGSHE